MKRILIALINFYQRRISPALPPTCRFRPTCSQYAKEAIEIHGAIFGICLALLRILRCHPFSKGGYDPVPERKRQDAVGEGRIGALRQSEYFAKFPNHSSPGTADSNGTSKPAISGGNTL